jgi:hypothetical protein
LTYGVDALRITLVNGGNFGLALDVLVITGGSVLLLALGTWLFEGVEV